MKKKPGTTAKKAAKKPAKLAAKSGAKIAGVKQRSTSTRKVPAPAAAPVALFYRLNTLLHTVRLIAGFEDHLCTLVHEVKTQGLPSPELTRDLVALFDEMPSSAIYREDLETAREVLAPAPAAVTHPSAKKAGRSSASVTRSAESTA